MHNVSVQFNYSYKDVVQCKLVMHVMHLFFANELQLAFGLAVTNLKTLGVIMFNGRC